VTVARRWVFPIIWIIIIAAATAALVKIAFFPDVEAGADPAQPGAVITDPEWVVETGTVRNDVTLTGTIAADAAVAIPATLAGEVWEVMVGQGQWVDAGAEIAEIRAQAARSDGTPYTTYKTVTAPISGVLSSFPTLEGTITTVGGAMGQIAPPTFNVTGPIPPAELYRLIQKPTEATVTINGGPAPFTCTNLQILTPVAGQDSGGSGGTGGTGGETVTGPTIRCSVPGDVTVFAGLSADIVIAGGVAENVVVIPTTAVLGRSGTGIVHVVLPDGGSEEREIGLGINDGSMVQVTSGLEAGETILQFVPGAPAVEGGGSYPMDGMICTDTPKGTECTAP
jgi:hypothetical protein